MAIIYTYPEISDLQLNDLALVTDKSDNNNTKQASISQILSLIPPGVDSLNGFTGNIDIIAGNNITIDNVTGQNKIEIASTSNTISSGNNGEFAFFSGTGSTLSGSPLLTATSSRIFIQDYISHKDNSTGNTAFFGFNDDNEFLVYLDSGAQERLQLKDDFFSVYTGSTPKISAGATYASLAHELVSAAPTRSASTLVTTERGVKISTTYRSDSAGSDLGFGGQIQFAASQDAGKYVGLMGPISSELTANYNLMLPNEPGASGQLLAVGATSHGTSPNQYRKLEWIDGGSAVGVTKITAGSGITLNPSSGLGEVEITASGGGTITGGGASNQVAYYSGASAITGVNNLRLTNSGVLISGSFADDESGSIYIENEEGSQGGLLRLYGQEHATGANKYINLYASRAANASAYNLYFPPSVPDGAGKIMRSNGTSGELEWADENTYSAGTGLSLSTNTFSLAAGAALTNLSGGTGTTYLKKDGTWDTPAGGINFSGSTVGGLVTYSNSTTANVSSSIKINPGISQIIGNNGIKANPTYSFESNTDSGMYCNAGGDVFISSSDSNSASFYSDKVQSNQLHEFNEYTGWKLGSAGDVYDCYESGNWIPSAYVPQGASVSPPTLSNAKGTFRKSGDIVHITFTITVSQASSGSLDMAISGLPFGGSNPNSVGSCGTVTIIANSGTGGSANLNTISGNVGLSFISLKIIGTNNGISNANWSPGLAQAYTITGAGSYRAT